MRRGAVRTQVVARLGGAVLLAVVLWIGSVRAAQPPLLPLQPQQVELVGTLRRKAFFVRPGSGDDRRETHLVLQLDEPVRVASPSGDALAELDELQVTEPDANVGAILDVLEGHRTALTGTLFVGHTAHHFTRVVVRAVTARPLRD